jgi:hypothetical protein
MSSRGRVAVGAVVGTVMGLALAIFLVVCSSGTTATQDSGLAWVNRIMLIVGPLIGAVIGTIAGALATLGTRDRPK